MPATPRGHRADARALRPSSWFAATVVGSTIALALPGGVAAAAPTPAVDVAPDTAALAGQTVPVPVTLTGFPTANDLVAVLSVPATGGTLTVTPSGGLTPEHGYGGFAGQQTIGVRGTAAEVTAALASLTWSAPVTGSPQLSVSVSEVPAGVYYDPDNGHYYQLGSLVDPHWTAARADAATHTLFGMTGYLATITSAEENDFIATHTTAVNAWIGASDAAVEGTWEWVTGPEAGTAFWQGVANGTTVGGEFASWAVNEPNDWNPGPDDEDYAGTNFGFPGSWNDFLDDPNSQGGSVATNQLIEFGGNAETSTAARADITADLTVATAPGAPGPVTTTPGDGSVLVRWTPPASDGGSAITRYTVTAAPGGATCSWTSGPLECTVTGLTNGTAYTFTVVATSAAASGPPSPLSAPAVPASAPPVAWSGPPAVTAVTATPATPAARGDGVLAATGSDVLGLAGAAAVLIGAGGAMLAVTRRRARS